MDKRFMQFCDETSIKIRVCNYIPCKLQHNTDRTDVDIQFVLLFLNKVYQLEMYVACQRHQYQ